MAMEPQTSPLCITAEEGAIPLVGRDQLMSKQPDDGTDTNSDSLSPSAAPARSGPVVPAPKQALQKVTLYVRPEQIILLEEIQLKERRRTGVRPDKSALVQEALDLLIQKYSKQF
jgi:hypothetical protein